MHMHQNPSPCACTILRKASRAVTRVYDEHLAGHGMTVTQFSILRNLARAAALPLSELAEKLVMDRTSLYRTIAPVERNGWVAITNGTGRAKLAQLTDAGRAAMAAAEPDWEATQTQILGGIAPAEWQALQATLGRLIEATRP